MFLDGLVHPPCVATFKAVIRKSVFHCIVVFVQVTTHCCWKCKVIHIILECGPIPNVIAALPNIGGTLCSTPQNLADAHY